MGLWYHESYKDQIQFGLKIKQTLFVGQSDFQKVAIVDTEAFGRALLLDDVWMTSEWDEHYYHELLVHPAMTTAPAIEDVLIVGGGDGGSSREVLRYAEVKHLTLVEIDPMVVEACRAHLPTIGTAWDDPRLSVHFEDAIAWVERAAPASFDVILVDGADPVGPAAGLFGHPFLDACRRALRPHGVFVTQNESPVIYRDTHIQTIKTIEEVFGYSAPYYSTVPLYCGGEWSWTFGATQTRPQTLIQRRLDQIEPHTHIYNAEYHHGAFAIPNRIKRQLGR